MKSEKRLCLFTVYFTIWPNPVPSIETHTSKILVFLSHLYILKVSSHQEVIWAIKNQYRSIICKEIFRWTILNTEISQLECNNWYFQPHFQNQTFILPNMDICRYALVSFWVKFRYYSWDVHSIHYNNYIYP